jgi:hypothetical protein
MSANRIIGGVEYEKVPTAGACIGCVGHHPSAAARLLCEMLNHDCANAVWKEVKFAKDLSQVQLGEPKYTVDEVLDVLVEMNEWDDTGDRQVTPKVKARLRLKSDPELAEFKRLSEKFGELNQPKF